MQKVELQGNCTTEQSALKLLKVEHRALVDWLHDDLAQNLVAIKSFAAAIIEQNRERADDTAEIADIIKQAADNAYRAAYDLMQELRAQDGADEITTDAISTCLIDARLKEKNIAYRLHVDSDLDALDNFTKAVILRSVQTFINYSKQCTETPCMIISLTALSQATRYKVELRLSHQGEFEIAPEDAPAIRALRERVEAIGGEVVIETNDKDRLDLRLRLNPVPMSNEASK